VVAYTDKDIIDIARRLLRIPGSVSVRLVPIARGGSDRVYYRLFWSEKTAIFIHFNPERQENHYHVPIARFLDRIRIRVPAIMAHDPEASVTIMEDLGDADLWSYRHAPWDERRSLYQDTLTTICRLHQYPLDTFTKTGLTIMNGFDPDLYRWEQDYFRDNFLVAVCRFRPEKAYAAAFVTELDELSRRLNSHEQRLIHRDLQSQNVMIYRNKPVLIDFQGMRMGNPLYDAASLLYDPYVELTDEERMALLTSYYQMSSPTLSWKEFQHLFYEAGVQRLMQALGAYGFLGLKRGRTAFLDHLAGGLSHLRSALSKIESLPILEDIAMQCRHVVHNTWH